MLPLPLTLTERRLLASCAWPVVFAAVVAIGYVLRAFVAVVDTPDPFGVLATAALGFAPLWVLLWIALSTRRRLATGWVDTRIVAPTAIWLALGAILVILTTDYGGLTHLEPWCVVSVLPAISAALAVGALGLTLRRRWLRRDPSRWTPGSRR